jgi:hypothetical protein
VENCYGPVLNVYDLYGNSNSDWQLVNDYKQFSFGLITVRQLTYKLNRLIEPADQWNAQLQCTTALQANIPVDPLKYLSGDNSIGLPVTTTDYTNWSMLMFISLISLFGAQIILWTVFLVYLWKYPEMRMHPSYLFYGWPETRAGQAATTNRVTGAAQPKQKATPVPSTKPSAPVIDRKTPERGSRTAAVPPATVAVQITDNTIDTGEVDGDSFQDVIADGATN